MPVDLVRIAIEQDYLRSSERMTMREAVETFVSMPEADQRCTAIDPVEPFEQYGGLIATVSFLEIPVLASCHGFFIDPHLPGGAITAR